ncbi:hypothetical protein evm_011769 [Chilo suppressalis]|nr:hypothetical protein evm_011769 [Chilo suppressalis]
MRIITRSANQFKIQMHSTKFMGNSFVVQAARLLSTLPETIREEVDPDDVIYAYDDPQSGVSAGGDDEPFVGSSTSSVMPAPDPLLGADIANQKNYGDALHNDIASRWSYILANGLYKDTYVELIKCYAPSENCPLMRALKLNLEIKTAVKKINIKKKKNSQNKQNQLGCSLAAIGRVLNWSLSPESSVPQDMIKSLSDAGGTATHSTSGRAAVGPCTTPTAEEPTATSGNITGTQLDQQHAATGKEAILGSQSSPPISRDAYPGGSQIIREVLIKRGVPQTSLRILMDSFANATL